MKRILLAASLVATATPVAHADLRYTTRVEVRATPLPTASDPAFAAVGAMLRTMMPPGDSRTLVKGSAVRIEQGDGASATVVLMRPDGTVILDSNTQTYWRAPSLSAFATGAASAPQATFRRTGEFATIMGLRAERILFTMPMHLPVTPPPGVATVMTMDGEMWLASAFTAYAKAVAQATGVTPAGRRDLPDGMVLRQVMRNAQFGYEVEYVVTDLAEAPLASALFEIPDAYRERSPFK